MQNINPIVVAPHCPACGSEMKLREKDDSKFWGCPHYKECGGKTIPYGVQKKPFQKEGKVNMSAIDPIAILAEEIVGLRQEQDKFRQHFDERMNLLGKYLQKHLEEKQEIDVKELKF
jgi:ssDNA-binding Zn-finger/Zn-ribbon topoisomerase 1